MGEIRTKKVLRELKDWKESAQHKDENLKGFYPNEVLHLVDIARREIKALCKDRRKLYDYINAIQTDRKKEYDEMDELRYLVRAFAQAPIGEYTHVHSRAMKLIAKWDGEAE